MWLGNWDWAYVRKYLVGWVRMLERRRPTKMAMETFCKFLTHNGNLLGGIYFKDHLLRYHPNLTTLPILSYYTFLYFNFQPGFILLYILRKMHFSWNLPSKQVKRMRLGFWEGKGNVNLLAKSSVSRGETVLSILVFGFASPTSKAYFSLISHAKHFRRKEIYDDIYCVRKGLPVWRTKSRVTTLSSFYLIGKCFVNTQWLPPIPPISKEKEEKSTTTPTHIRWTWIIQAIYIPWCCYCNAISVSKYLTNMPRK